MSTVPVKKVFELLGEYYNQNNEMMFFNTIGDHYADKKFRALGQIVMAMQVIKPETLETLVNFQSNVSKRTELYANLGKDSFSDANATEDSMVMMIEYFNKIKNGEFGDSESVRRHAALCATEIENALFRYRAGVKGR
jgi:hypothetical protein